MRSDFARRASCAVGIAVALLAVPAAAQEQPASPSAPNAASPAAAPTAEAKEQARLHFSAGVNLLKDPEKARYEEAYAEFKKAYELVGSPSILGNIGLCAMKLERDVEALEAYTKYLAEVPSLDPQERAQTERDIVTLKAGIARITIETNPPGAILHDSRVATRGEGVTNIYGPIKEKQELGLRRGHHIIKARFPDGREAAWEANIAGGESHVFDAPAVAVAPAGEKQAVQTTRPIPQSVYIGALVTGAAGIGSIVTGVLALNSATRYDTANNGTDTSKANDLRTSTETLNVATDVFLGVTIIGAAVTTYLYLSRPSVTSSVGATRFSPGLIRF